MKYARFLLVALFLCATTLTMTGCGSSQVTSSNNPVDSSPPAAPTAVSMTTENATSRDFLNWNPSASSDVVNYEVFRFADASSTTGGVLVGTVSSDQDYLLLPLVGAGVTEFYRVRAVNSNDVPSSYSTNCSADRTAWVGGDIQTDGQNGAGKEGVE